MNALPGDPGVPGSARRRLDWFAWGSAAVVVAAVLQSWAFAARSGLFSSADEAAHVDYAYQVWHGALPVFAQGLVLNPGFGSVPPVQWTAQHPPLFYALLAPVVGPLVDSGHVVAAGYAARALTAVMAGAVVAAVVWGARQVLTSRRHWALAAGVVAASNSWLVRVGGSVYNDVPSTLFSTLLIGLTARAIRRGLTWRLTAALAGAAAGGMLSRASVAVVLAACLAALVLAAPPRAARWRGLLPTGSTFLRAVLVGLAAVVAAGWFYLRNLRLTGSLIGGDPEWAAANLGREPRPLLDLLTDPAALQRLYSLFSYGELSVRAATFVLLVVPAALGVVAVVRAWPRADVRTRRARVSVGLFLGGTTGLVLAQQALYSAGGGGLNPRYLLPLLLPVCLLLAVGLLLPERARGGLLVAWVVLVQVDWWAFVLAGFGDRPPLPAYPAVALLLSVAALAALAVACAAVVRGSREPAPATVTTRASSSSRTPGSTPPARTTPG